MSHKGAHGGTEVWTVLRKKQLKCQWLGEKPELSFLLGFFSAGIVQQYFLFSSRTSCQEMGDLVWRDSCSLFGAVWGEDCPLFGIVHFIQQMTLSLMGTCKKGWSLVSQNHRRVGVGRDLCGSSSPTPLPKQGHLKQVAQNLDLYPW